MLLPEIFVPQTVVGLHGQLLVPELIVVRISAAADVVVKVVVGAVFLIFFGKIRKNQPQKAAVGFIDGHIQLLMDFAAQIGQRLAVPRLGTGQVKGAQRPAIHQTVAAPAVDPVVQPQSMQAAAAVEGVVFHIGQKGGQGQILQIAVIPLPFSAVGDEHLLPGDGRGVGCQRMIPQHGHRQAKQLVGQNRPDIAGLGPQKDDMILFPSDGQLPVALSLQDFHGQPSFRCSK